MMKFNADTLQDMYLKVNRGEITREDAAAYHKKGIGSINNYFQAKQAYEEGREVYAKNISTKAFTPWALKYGGKGEPIYKPDFRHGRKHIKKESEQITMSDADINQMSSVADLSQIDTAVSQCNETHETEINGEVKQVDQQPAEPKKAIASVYKNDRQSCLIADRIADVAIRAINALLDMDKRRNDLLASQS